MNAIPKAEDPMKPMGCPDMNLGHTEVLYGHQFLVLTDHKSLEWLGEVKGVWIHCFMHKPSEENVFSGLQLVYVPSKLQDAV